MKEVVVRLEGGAVECLRVGPARLWVVAPSWGQVSLRVQCPEGTEVEVLPVAAREAPGALRSNHARRLAR